MSERFPVPAKAIETAGKTQNCGCGIDACQRQGKCYETCAVVVESVLEAALPVLAADPDLIERAARALCTGDPDRAPYGESQSAWPAWQDQTDTARKVLAALFGVASPSTTKETETT